MDNLILLHRKLFAPREKENLVDQLDHTALNIAKRFEQWIYDYSKDGNQIYTAGEQTYLGTPVILKPQRTDKHQHELFTHMLYTVWGATNYKELAEILSYPATVVHLYESLEESEETAFCIAAYLHDVDKVFEPKRPYNDSSPYKKPDKEAPASSFLDENLSLSLGINGQETSSELRSKVISFMTGPIRNENPNTTFLTTLIPEELKLEVREILKIYSIIDETIIKISQSNSDEESAQLLLEGTRKIKDQELSQNIKFLGIILMAADNYAQGNPPETKSSQEVLKAFKQEQIRNWEIINWLLDKIIYTQLGKQRS